MFLMTMLEKVALPGYYDHVFVYVTDRCERDRVYFR